MKKAFVLGPTATLLLATTSASAQVSPPTARFAATPVEFSVPDSGSAGGFFATAMGDGNKHWATMDVTGDGKPDLIQTADPKTGEAFDANVKNPHWTVYTNDGTGMKPNPATVSWTLPDSGTAGGFRSVAAGQTNRQWALLNIRSTAVPDLVQVADPATLSVFGAGSPPSPPGYWGYWKFYNIESLQKFNKTPHGVRLRPSGKQKGFAALASASGTDHWATMDLNGDTVMDLVQTTDPATGKPWVENGKKVWHMFRGTESGTDMEMGMYGVTPWPIPDAGFEAGFTDVAKNDGTKQWVVFDLDGDKKPDLVQTADPTTGKVWGAGTDKRHWRVFKGTGSGFAMQPTLWPVPDSGFEAGFAQATSGGAKNWVTLDLDGDGKPDLVQTSQNDGTVWGAGTASPYWKLFKNTGFGFAPAAANFPVPQMGLQVGFFAISQGTATKYWTLMDINGDKRLDLVQTADPSTGSVWGAPASMAGASGGSGGGATPTPAAPKQIGPGAQGAVAVGPKVLARAVQPRWRVYLGQP